MDGYDVLRLDEQTDEKFLRTAFYSLGATAATGLIWPVVSMLVGNYMKNEGFCFNSAKCLASSTSWISYFAISGVQMTYTRYVGKWGAAVLYALPAIFYITAEIQDGNVFSNTDDLWRFVVGLLLWGGTTA